MPFLRDFIGQPLAWKRPRFLSSTYELQGGGQVLATVVRVGTLRPRLLATSEGQQWTFKREGIMQARVVIYASETSGTAESSQPLAMCKRRANGHGELTLPNGRVYSWTHKGYWRPDWFWVGPLNQPLLTLKKGYTFEIDPAASDLPELALLTVLGFSLLQMKREEDAAVAATTVVHG